VTPFCARWQAESQLKAETFSRPAENLSCALLQAMKKTCFLAN